jgi:hypothetical protein
VLGIGTHSVSDELCTNVSALVGCEMALEAFLIAEARGLLDAKVFALGALLRRQGVAAAFTASGGTHHC